MKEKEWKDDIDSCLKRNQIVFAIFKEKEALIIVKKRLSTEVTFSNALILLDIENPYRFDKKDVMF